MDIPASALDILVVEDEPRLRDVLVRRFTLEGHRVVGVGDGASALERATSDHFDIVLLDVALGPGPSGYDVCRTLRAQNNLTPIIMLTGLGSEADAVQGLEAGADDYVTKPVGLAELRSRVRAVLRRGGAGAAGSDVVRIGEVELDVAQRTVMVRGQPASLTFSEFELLSHLMAPPRRVFSREELLHAIWGESDYRDPRGIDVHVRHLREKVEEHPDDPQLIITVRGAGYRAADG